MSHTHPLCHALSPRHHVTNPLCHALSPCHTHTPVPCPVPTSPCHKPPVPGQLCPQVTRTPVPASHTPRPALSPVHRDAASGPLHPATNRRRGRPDGATPTSLQHLPLQGAARGRPSGAAPRLPALRGMVPVPHPPHPRCLPHLPPPRGNPQERLRELEVYALLRSLTVPRALLTEINE
ncbi:splicing factor 3A subunit 2-like [Vidua chalybeata]|uniref:splicing factor 3A subunit 2-like n=1 Tax=Vidua chalybeata TaxID=81927 RepID=UPI0023A8B72B|nr:splicing factor 3A subunit 2-like [Vidua chalybeata]